MTLEELLEMMQNNPEVGIRCSSIAERDELGDFLIEHTGGRRGWWDDGSTHEQIIFWNETHKCFETTADECVDDIFYKDIAHLLDEKPVVPVIVDDLI